MTKLFLDDVRPAFDSSWSVVRSYPQFVEWMRTNPTPDVISFDHDLGFEHYPLGEQNPGATIPYETYKEKTGYDAAKWCVENNRVPERVVVHSFNVVGARNIAELLGKHTSVIIRPYGQARF